MPIYEVHTREITTRVVYVEADDPEQAIALADETEDDTTHTEPDGADVYLDGRLLTQDAATGEWSE